MLGNLPFTRRTLVNFFFKNLHFFFIEYLFQIYCLLSSEWSSKCSSTWFAAVLDMPGRRVDIGPGAVVVLVVRPDQEEIGIIVALEIGVQLGIQGESERFVVFTGWIYFSKRCRTLELEVSWRPNRFSHLRAHYVSFICVSPFRNFHIPCIFTYLPFEFFFLSRLLHQEKWKFTVYLKLKWTNWKWWRKFAFCTLEFWEGSRLGII